MKELEPKLLKQLKTLLKNMKKRWGYCFNCARATILYFIDKKLGND